MKEIKVRLSLEVPGATMLSSQDCDKLSKKDAYDHSVMVIETQEKKGKKLIKHNEVLHINTRKLKTVKQNISICKEAYAHMIDSKEIPTASIRKAWGGMSKKQRLEFHLNNIAEHFNAVSFSYEILDD